MSVSKRIFSFLVALALVNALLLAPQWVLAGGPGPLWIAMEAWLVVGLFALLPVRPWVGRLAAGTAALLLLLGLLGVADAATRQSLARPLNIYLDAVLLSAVDNLLTGALGPAMSTTVMIGAIVCVALLGWLLARLLAPRLGGHPTRASRVLGLALVGVFAVGILGGGVPALTRRMSLPAIRIAVDQTRHFIRMLSERERFTADLDRVPADYATLPGLLAHLRGRDVLLGFVESYGISALDDARYAPVILPRLDELAARTRAAGLHLVTGALVAPSQGGQSWLAHGSLLSGAWLDNQLRYDLLLASGRETLIDDFRRAGHRTVAIMPAITLAWPEGERLGYDEIHAREDIDYAGPPLNWVTMPDQFTWSFLQHTIRTPAAGQARPLFAELGLISSHAPWTPILTVLDDWESIGDGAVFARWKNAGERPTDLWQDVEGIRQHYALSIDYALAVMTGYAERYVDDRTLLIVLGDHQPAPLITGDDASRAVPVHVMSADPALIEPFLAWGFVPGARPAPDRAPPRMDAFRDWFVRAYSDPDAPPRRTARAED
jgi:hypothetical protein